MMNNDSLLLETPRLLLRPIRREDFDGFAQFSADPDSTRHLGGPQPRAVAWRSFLTMAGAWAVQGFAMFSLIEKASGRWVGRVSLATGRLARHGSGLGVSTSILGTRLRDRGCRGVIGLWLSKLSGCETHLSHSP